MKSRADAKRQDEEFEVGEKVFVKFRPYRQKSLANQRNEKLAPRFYGPFEIVARVGAVAYNLSLPLSSSIHNVFHVSLLRRAHGVTNSSSLLPPHLSPDLELFIEPVEVIGVRHLDNDRPALFEVLIQWKDLPLFDTTWEQFDTIQHQFSLFPLEDKVKAWAVGNDRPPIMYTYARRKK